MDLALNVKGMYELSEEEQRQTDGGWLVIAIVVVLVIIFAAGVYSGYRDAAANNK